MSETIRAVIFDLDGVITDTAEYHYRAWKRLADEEGLSFSREDNERLRGVSREESLRRLLKGRELSDAQMQEWMTRKNDYYRAMLAQITPGDLLPGVARLLDELDHAQIPYAIASASRNVPDVVARLGIADRLSMLVDGSSVTRQKPAPDLFRCAAAKLNISPAECLVVEDAEAGIAAALAAGMRALALGPAERFAGLPGWYGARHDNLESITLDDLYAAARVDPRWVELHTSFDPAEQHHRETIFTTGNGYFCSRGSLEEGYPGDHALTLAHGVFDDMPIVYTELANLPNWLNVVITVNGQRYRLDQGQHTLFQRQLNLRTAVLMRNVRWQAPDGTLLDLTFERFVSYAHPHVAALRVLITPVNRACEITVATGIDGFVSNEDLLHWNHLGQGQTEDGTLWLHSRTRHSGLELGTAAQVIVPGGSELAVQQCPHHPRAMIAQSVEVGQTLQVDKLVSYTTSRDRAADAANVVRRATAALDGHTYDELKAKHIAAWTPLWDSSDVVIEGDTEAQIALRFNIYQLLIAAPQHDDRVSIGAKTLSGLGYRGHVFWDTEIFIVPVFTYTQPHLARNLLMYRYHTLDGARRKAAENGFEGAQYAWESALTGDETTPKWVPDFEGKNLIRIWTGDIQIHISADIAYAIDQYWHVTGDDAFMRDYGAEIILDTARFWGDRAELEVEDGQHRYAFRDVIGPDEWHEHVDNNTYTNRMAQWHLQKALDMLAWLESHAPEKARQLRETLDLSPARLDHWRDVIDNIIILYDADSGVFDQFEGFFDLEHIDPAIIRQTDKSMQIVLGIEGGNQTQILKQADVIMLLCLFRDQYDQRTWQANWDTYMPITDHQYGSSLGPSFHAWAACEMDRPDEAYEHFMLAARADLRDIRGNAGDGIHAASAGGLWQAVVFGFAGLRLTDDGLTLRPRLPEHWQRVQFSIRYRGEMYSVEVSQGGEARITQA